MLKPSSLRERLATAFPDDFGHDSQRLAMWVEEGHVRCHAAPDNLNYSIEYKLSVSITGWKGQSAMLWIYVIDWLRVQQPDLLTPARSAEAIPFEVDIIDKTTVDIGFDLRLTEPVTVTRREDGGFDMRVVPEPDPLFPDAGPLLPDGPALKSIWVEGRQLVPEDFAA